MNPKKNNPIRHDLALFIAKHPIRGTLCALTVGFGYAVEFVSPRLSLWFALRELRRVDVRLLTLKKKNHV